MSEQPAQRRSTLFNPIQSLPIARSAPYRKLRALLDAESLEPSLSWGLRMAVATVAPIAWGIATSHAAAAEWIALAADCVCWVALKGTYAQRVRILLGGALLTLLAAALGSLTGASLAWSVVCMAAVGFLAMLFRNLGERGSGLSLCLYVMFLIANAHPVAGDALRERLSFIAAGGAWNFLLGITTILFLPAQQPYRRTIALIWRASAGLMAAIAKGWNGKGVRSSQREIYLAEKSVREAIDISFAFHERAVHQIPAGEDAAEARLAQARKSAALVSAHMVAVSEELESLRLVSLPEDLRLRVYALLHAVQRAADRMSALVLTRRAEEAALARDLLDGISKQAALLEGFRGPAPLPYARQMGRVMQLCERCARLMAHSAAHIEGVEELTMIRSYSALKTVYVLHPKHWWRSIRLLFDLDSHTARYAVRTALAAALCTAIYKYWHLDRGYWLPFTVLIVVQPYFVATLRKAVDRTVGTLAGGLAGGLVLLLPAALHLKEVMLFCSAMMMIYFFRARYRVSAFFITLNLVMLLSVSQELSGRVILERALLTVTGAVIAVGAAFLLLPAWDKRWLPRYVARALERNWSYFRQTFGDGGLQQAQWTRCKRQAEVANSNAYDSFNRAMQEPRGLQRAFSRYYQLITHSVRVTRELNNIHLEEEAKSEGNIALTSSNEGLALLVEGCARNFRAALDAAEQFSGKDFRNAAGEDLQWQVPVFNAAQRIYLERLSGELLLLRETLEGLVGNGAD